MTLKEYQKKTQETAIYPDTVAVVNSFDNIEYIDYVYPMMGLIGEVGELSNKLQKNIRDNNGDFNALNINDLADEIGDVMWYISQLCNELGIDLEEVITNNVIKLQSRKERGKLGGSGDKR